MTKDKTPKPVVLCILDGWGHREEADNNAVALGRTPVFDALWETCPKSLLEASEHFVGLPGGQMGNSEVGHMNIGAGRVVLQDLARIDVAVDEGRLAKNPALEDFIKKLRKSGGTAHLMGLLSPGGVHAHQDHIAALFKLLDAAGVPAVLHAFLDGRDTPPKSAAGFMGDFLADCPSARIATVIGRYYAMDRDNRWERVARAYAAIAEGEGKPVPDAARAIAEAYELGLTDEFVEPAVVDEYRGMANGDGILMANFRADRAREILASFLDPDFEGFPRSRTLSFAAAAGMVEYSERLNEFLTTLFSASEVADTLGETVSRNGLRQLRIAETEKYAHVTFFLNGGREATYDGEERILVPSPKVATYDLKPEMSALEVTDRLVDAVEGGRFDLIVCNYANGDMVGHSGQLPAAIKAVETLDACLGRLKSAVEKSGGCLLITADHGNCEEMVDPVSGQPHTAHSMNRVPFILAGAPGGVEGLDDGRLADISPTVLDLMHLPRPEAMTGRSLIRRYAGEAAAQ